MKNLLISILLLTSFNSISQTQLKFDTTNAIISTDTIKGSDTTLIIQSIFNDTMPCEEVVFKLLGIYLQQQQIIENQKKLYERMIKAYEQYIEINKNKLQKIEKELEEIKSEPQLTL